MNTNFDEELREIQFYKQYDQYLPFIGDDYSINRILVLGESHFFAKKNKKITCHEVWYKNDKTALDDDQIRWTNTRLVVENFKETTSRRAMFYKIDTALRETNYDDGIQNIAFMNAFQRPASGKGEGIEAESVDIKQSAKVINQVIGIIKPKILCFVSRKAYKKLSKELNFEQSLIYAVVHPTCPWWNRKTKKGTDGKEEFRKVLEKAKNL